MVTFLFSDIEGSTQRWESDRVAMDAAVKRHEAIVRGTVKRHNGFVFKTVGDAFCVAFTTVFDAVEAAVDAQRSLAAEDFSAVGGLHVRVALHTGEASERDGDYFGPTVNRVARLASIGHGGQVLLSGITRDLAFGDIPTDASLIDLGLRRLKDLTQPEQVWQLAIEGLRSEFPPLNSLDARVNNLPIPVTSLLGRERDLEEVKTLVGMHRLVTISGSGGVGKTRLALQVGADLLDRYPDGVWFADLGPISDPELVASVIAKTLRMAQSASQRVEDAIPKWLMRKQLLLIIDNCEHVLEAVTGIAEAIVFGCPEVRLLATSRQALSIGGEEVFRLPSLDVPQTLVGLTPETVRRFGAVALFVDRAKSVDKSFKLNDDTAPIVASICCRLDGIPLAIELAAARVKVMSVSNLAQRLRDRFKILTGGSRTALPRQKTLGALIDWSYALLTPSEQSLFNRAGIFAGDFSLEAATAVCGDEGSNEIDVLDVLASLVDKSLLIADTTGERERYRLLESTRSYALEKLNAACDHDRFARRHAEYYRDQAQAADKRFGTGSTAAWLAKLETDLDNFREALEWALKGGNDIALGAAVAGALDRVWRHAGLAVEGRYWIGLARAGLDEAALPHVAARLSLALARLSAGKRLHECAQHALVLYELVGDRHGAAWARFGLAWSLSQMGRRDEATEAIQRSLTSMRDLGDKYGEAECLDIQASIYRLHGDLAGARELFTQAIAAHNAVGNESGITNGLGNLAELEFEDARYSEALRLCSDALQIALRGKNATQLAFYYSNLAAYRIALQDLNRARTDAREALRWARQARDILPIVMALQHLALLGTLRGADVPAAGLMGYVDTQFKKLAFEREHTERWGYEILTATLRDHLIGDEVERLAAAGAAWSEEFAIEAALQM